MINRPGLKCPVVDQHASLGQQTPPPTMHLQDAVSPFLSFGTIPCAALFFIISSYLFSLLSQGNTPSSVCGGISGSSLGT